MRAIVHKTFSMIMAALLLLSTVSWTVDKHLCMGRVMDISFFVHADDCAMEEVAEAMGESLEIPCCDDESFTLTGLDDLKPTWNDLDLDNQIFLVSFINSYFNLFVPDGQQKVFRETHPPPNLVKDICILHQTFLI